MVASSLSFCFVSGGFVGRVSRRRRIPSWFFPFIVALIGVSVSGLYYLGIIPGLPLSERIAFTGMFVSFMTLIGYLVMTNVEQETGLSIVHGPRVDFEISSQYRQSIRDVLYAVSSHLASSELAVKAGERYVLGTDLRDSFPDKLSLSVGFFRMRKNGRGSSASKVARCVIDFDEMVLSVTGGSFGKRAFTELYSAITTELTSRQIPWNTLVDRRPS